MTCLHRVPPRARLARGGALVVRPLRAQLAKAIHMDMLKESPALQDAPTQFFELLALKFTQGFAMPDEIIFRCAMGCARMGHICVWGAPLGASMAICA